MKYLGMDVSKLKLDCSLLGDAAERGKAKVVANSPAGYQALGQWLARQGQDWPQVHVLLEATGVYHEAAALWLHEAGARVSVLNPAQARDLARGLGIQAKSDALDSRVLARLGVLRQPPAWQPPAPELRVLKALLGRLQAIEADLLRERNRREKALAGQAPALILESLELGIGFLSQEQARLRHAVDEHIDRHPGLKADAACLRSIPAVGAKTAAHLLLVLRGHVFRDADQAAAFLGLAPVMRQSGSSLLRRPRLGRNGDPRTRATLYMAALTAIRYNPDVKALYERLLAKGKPKMAALGAAMRKLVLLAYGVLKHQQPYRPFAHVHPAGG